MSVFKKAKPVLITVLKSVTEGEILEDRLNFTRLEWAEMDKTKWVSLVSLREWANLEADKLEQLHYDEDEENAALIKQVIKELRVLGGEEK